LEVLRATSASEGEAGNPERDESSKITSSPGAEVSEPWTSQRLRAAFDAYHAGHRWISLDPDARNLRHTYVLRSEEKGIWRVQQMLVDPDGHNDWVAEFEVDLARSKAMGEPVLRLVKLGALVGGVDIAG
jgi:hypothetical protein